MELKCAVSLHRDFFIVLDLRLTKRLVVGRDGSLPFVFYRALVLKKMLDLRAKNQDKAEE